MKVIGVSGSPAGNGSVDRLVQIILQNLGQWDSEFISLRNLRIDPCKGCMACTGTNRCVQKDDWAYVEDKIRQAELMVLGVPTYYGAAFGVNGLTHNFLERWFSLRHQGFKSKINKVILAAVSGEEHGNKAIENLKTFFEMYHGIKVVDSVVARGTTPCYVCGFGEQCPLSAFLHRHGEGAKITADMFVPLAEQDDVISHVKKIRDKIGDS
ncbi:MAG: flavodoxin family protein [Firmicutes bacterium]|nr:flavodoxin family protein [Bacillota bacterium]